MFCQAGGLATSPIPIPVLGQLGGDLLQLRSDIIKRANLHPDVVEIFTGDPALPPFYRPQRVADLVWLGFDRSLAKFHASHDSTEHE